MEDAGFAFWMCHREMGFMQVEKVISSLFAKFDAHCKNQSWNELSGVHELFSFLGCSGGSKFGFGLN